MRKRVSRRRWKARFRQGKPIPYIVVEHALWSSKLADRLPRRPVHYVDPRWSYRSMAEATRESVKSGHCEWRDGAWWWRT